MNQAVSLFNELKSGGYDTCLMTTFSIDFPFYEDVLLRRMQSSGISHHVLLADKSMTLAAMKERPPSKVGSQYVLAPMACPGAFHPKLLLLLGKNKGLLAVGSHNCTLSGFGQNLEITNILRFTKGQNEQYLAIFQQAFQAFQTWLSSYGSHLPDSVKELLDRSGHLSPWLKTTLSARQNPECQLLYTATNTDSLWQQMQPYIPENIKQIFGMSAFFDTQLAFIKKLIGLSDKAPVIAVQPDTVSAPKSLLNNSSIQVVDVNSVDDISQKKRYVHAKLLYLAGEESLFVSGSANFSRPAWLNDGANSNAEAIIVVNGDAANSIATNLALPQLINAPIVESIDVQRISTLDEDVTSVSLILLDDTGADAVIIPMQIDWPTDHCLAYTNSFDEHRIIEASKKNSHWEISRSAFREGELISVITESAIIARIIVMNTAQLRHNSAGGQERRLQQALGSLNSDNPDFNLLLNCIEQVIPSNNESNNSSKYRKSNSTSTESDIPDSLLSDLDPVSLHRAASGRVRISTGDIGLLLDMFIYNLGNASRNDSSKAFGEDASGRNEEDLIESEDGENSFTEEDILLSDIDAIDRADQLCRRKLQTILKRTVKFIKSFKRIENAPELKQIIPLVLGVLVLTHELYLAQEKQTHLDRSWVTQDFFDALSELLFLNFFSEKNPIYGDTAHPNLSSAFLSDEWCQILGYSTWVAYHADIVLKPRLSLSATIEDKQSVSWKNACWLFLAQRIGKDAEASKITTKLLSQEGKQAESWLTMMVESGKQLAIKRQLPIHTGFYIASSPKAAFSGYKLVTDSYEDKLSMANINTKQNTQRFQIGYLDIFKV